MLEGFRKWSSRRRRLGSAAGTNRGGFLSAPFKYKTLEDNASNSNAKAPLLFSLNVLSLPSSTGQTRLTPSKLKRYILHGICHSFTPRKILYAILLAGTLVVISGAVTMAMWVWKDVPANYEVFRTCERRLMKQRYTRVGAEARLVRFPEHLWGHGFNNILQETFLMSYLAHLTNRSFVYEEYTWSKDSPFHWTIGDGMKLRPSRIPMTAFLSGFIVGTSKSTISHNNLSIPIQVSTSAELNRSSASVEYWQQVCANRDDITIVSSGDMPEGLVDGQELIDWWIRQLTTGDASKARCVQVDGPGSRREKKPIFDQHLFGSPSIHSILPGLISSPVITEFGWTPLIDMVLSKNHDLLHLQHAYTPDGITRTSPPIPSADTSNPSLHLNVSQNQPHPAPRFSGLLAVHVRRGDYERHCPRLANWGSMYMGINRLPGLVDRFKPWTAMSNPDSDRKNDEEDWVYVEESDYQDMPTESDPGSKLWEEPESGWYGCLDWRWWWSWFESSSSPSISMSAPKVSMMGTNETKPRYHQNLSDLDMENWFFEDSLMEGEAHPYRSKKSLWRVFDGNFQRTQEPPADLLEYYMRHCFPSIGQIRKRLKAIREEVVDTLGKLPSQTFGALRGDSTEPWDDELRRVYILTNGSGKNGWMRELKEGLLDDGWEEVIVGGDLDLDVEGELELGVGHGAYSNHDTENGNHGQPGDEKLRVGRLEVEGVMIAVDMAIAQGADVFVGNGFSSASANVVLLRLADGKDIATNRFL